MPLRSCLNELIIVSTLKLGWGGKSIISCEFHHTVFRAKQQIEGIHGDLFTVILFSKVIISYCAFPRCGVEPQIDKMNQMCACCVSQVQPCGCQSIRG